jgi:hypothetical protein
MAVVPQSAIKSPYIMYLDDHAKRPVADAAPGRPGSQARLVRVPGILAAKWVHRSSRPSMLILGQIYAIAG